ncbi:hypothetical protein ACFWFF_23910 [Streptomyces sp. NPDC060223]|uniref:hypothetical protein n=1 Tax=unclassified Streptomyces TaxID=2593676 RepID=UPI003635C58A
MAASCALDYVPFRELPLWLKWWKVVSKVHGKPEVWQMEIVYAVGEVWEALRLRRP